MDGAWEWDVGSGDGSTEVGEALTLAGMEQIIRNICNVGTLSQNETATH